MTRRILAVAVLAIALSAGTSPVRAQVLSGSVLLQEGPRATRAIGFDVRIEVSAMPLRLGIGAGVERNFEGGGTASRVMLGAQSAAAQIGAVILWVDTYAGPRWTEEARGSVFGATLAVEGGGPLRWRAGLGIEQRGFGKITTTTYPLRIGLVLAR